MGRKLSEERMIQDIELDKIVPHPDNPRLFLRQEVIDGIAAQIEANNNEFDPAHALLVRPVNEHFEILRGHHRIEAARKVGLDSIPCWVREMNDDDAYMQLALGNVQNELSPLEIGIHALKVVENGNGGRGNKGGLSKYAEQLGKTHGYISQVRQAATVLNTIKPVSQLTGLVDKSQHFSHIHKAPQEVWQFLADEMLSREWSAKDTDTETKKVIDVLNVIPEWWGLDQTVIAARALNNKKLATQAMLKRAGEVYDKLKPVIIYKLQETDVIENRNGREYRKWQSVGKEYDPCEVFKARAQALDFIPEKIKIDEIEKEILSFIDAHSSPTEVWRPVLTDEEFRQEQERLNNIARLEERKRYTPYIYFGDVIDGMAQLKNNDFDLICTDPPYNVGKAEWDKWETMEDYIKWCKTWLKECYRVLKPSGSFYLFGKFYALRYVSIAAERLGFILRREIIWDTIQGSGGAGLWPDRHETILYFTKSHQYYEDIDAIKLERHEEHIREYKGTEYNFKLPSTVWRFPCVDDKHEDRTEHPTQKPVELIERMILASCPTGGKVLDCFIGSGTTGVATMKLKRYCIGIEDNKNYIEIANGRFDNTEL